MTWQNQYTQNLNDEGPLGADFNYVLQIPAIGGNSPLMRLALRGPNSGSSRVQAMYIGHGSGYSFDGNQVPVTVGGQSSFTLNSGVAYSDPIDTTAFGFNGASVLYVAYQLLNGDKYRRNFSLGSQYVLHHKQGSGDAATTSKSGYSTNTGRAAVVEAIQLDIEQEQEEPPIEEPTVNSHEQVLAGQRHSSGEVLAGEAGKYLHVQFVNPSGTGKVGLLYELEITPDADTVLSFRSYVGNLGSAFPVKCNLYFGFGQASMHGRWSNEDAIRGVFHSIHKVKGGQRSIIRLDVPLVAINPGGTVVMALHTPGVGAVANIQWRELPNA